MRIEGTISENISMNPSGPIIQFRPTSLNLMEINLLCQGEVCNDRVS